MPKMIVTDRIYSVVQINEPVLIDLLQSPAMQRLKGINQFGMPQRFYPLPGYSRFEHSVGVMILLRKLGASLEEQAAGLIHDVSHTAFSHLVDWVIGNRDKEDYQDNNLENIIARSSIPKILQKHGLNSESVVNVKDFRLLEQPAPYLCADRVDYSLREFYTWAQPEIVPGCISDLTNYNGQIAFKNKNSAEKFAYAYAKCQREHWGGPECTVRWEILSKILKSSLERGVIELRDFYENDETVISKIRQEGDRETEKLFALLERPRLNIQLNMFYPQYDLKKKFRYIDPHYVQNDRLHRLSESDSTYAKFLQSQKELNERGIKVDLFC